MYDDAPEEEELAEIIEEISEEEEEDERQSTADLTKKRQEARDELRTLNTQMIEIREKIAHRTIFIEDIKETLNADQNP
jgi:hypothetical protein